MYSFFTRIHNWQLLLIHIALLIVVSAMVFERGFYHLYAHNDGATTIAVAHEQQTFFGVSPHFHSNVLQGLGNVSYGINLSLMPAYWSSFYDPAGLYAPVFSYVVFAVIFFLSVYIVGTTYCFSSGVTYFAAWFLAFLFFPCATPFRIYPVTSLIPHVSLMFFFAAVIDALCWRMGNGHWCRDIIRSILLLLAIMCVLLFIPILTMLIIVFCSASMVAAMWVANALQRVRKLVACASVLGIAWCLGWGKYVLGLHLFTASHFFMHDIEKGQISKPQISVLFQSIGHVDSVMGACLFVLAALGAAWAYRMRRRLPPTIGCAAVHMLLFQFVLVGVGCFFIYPLKNWVLPIPLYFEFLYFPFYALFAAFVLTTVIRHFLGEHLSVIRMTIIAAGAMIAAVMLTPIRHEPRDVAYSFPPPINVITQILRSDIALSPGKKFAGRVTSIIPAKSFHDQFYEWYLLAHHQRQEMLPTSFWLHRIPTLVEYNQLITPYFFWFTQQFLQAPGVSQPRNWVNFSRINIPALRLLGVRYILTPALLAPIAKERAVIPHSNGALMRLYEISQANISGVSAARVVQASDLQELQELLQSGSFVNQSAVIFPVAEEEKAAFSRRWSPASENHISVEKGGWHIAARSSGWTLLMVPIEFSRCLDITVLRGERPYAVRVNAVLTGLIFHRQMDIRMVTRTGIFHQPYCRWQDYKEFKALLSAAR